MCLLGMSTRGQQHTDKRSKIQFGHWILSIVFLTEHFQRTKQFNLGIFSEWPPH